MLRQAKQLFLKKQSLRRAIFLLVAVILGVSAYTTQPAHAAVAYRAATSNNNAAGATSLSLTMPTGTLANDVLIALISVRGGTGTTITPPSGWVAVPNGGSADSGTNLKSSVYYKVAGTGESGSYAFNFSSSQKASGVVSAYSGVDTLNPIHVISTAFIGLSGTTTMSTNSVTTSMNNTMLLAMFSQVGAATFTAGSGMTLRGTTSSTGGSTTSRTTSGLQDIIKVTSGNVAPLIMNTNAANTSYVAHLIALTPAAEISQAAYVLRQNTDSTTPSTPYAASNTAASIGQGVPFRLRLNLGVASTGGSSVTGTNYKLQYATRGTDNVCDTSFTSETYSDVTTSTPVAFYNNPTPADGAAYVTGANDPTRSGVTSVPQTYKESNPLSVTADVTAGKDGLWDIALTSSGTAAGSSYCLRAVTNAGSLLYSGYSVIPEVTFMPPTVSQANYRWYNNANAASPGAALAAQDTVAAGPAPGSPFRLRSLLRADTAGLTSGTGSYKLQYAPKVGTCDVGFSGETYADINPASTLSQSNLAASVFESSGTGTVAWTNAADARAPLGDGFYASASIFNGIFYTRWLTSYDHGFNLPSDATIKGIELKVYARRTGGGASSAYIDKARLVRNGVIESTGQASTTNIGNLGFDVVTLGSPTDMWGASWTPAEINTGTSLGFGAAISAKLGDGVAEGAGIDVDGIEIKVYYTVPTSPPPFSYYDNSSVANGATIAAGDPLDGARTVVPQAYLESDPFSNTAAIPAGQDGLWDFSLINNSATPSTSYCFRIVKSDGSLLNNYLNIPELTTPASAGPTLDQQLRGGQSVVGGSKGKFTW